MRGKGAGSIGKSLVESEVEAILVGVQGKLSKRHSWNKGRLHARRGAGVSLGRFMLLMDVMSERGPRSAVQANKCVALTHTIFAPLRVG